MRVYWQIFAAAMVLAAASSIAEPSDGNPLVTQDGNSGQNPANAKALYAEDVANELRPQEPDTDLLALMSGKCSTLKVAGRDFACRTVAYAHSTRGRAYFTIALDDPADHSHIISFSGENGRRTEDNLYELTVDRMLLNSKNRPKVDGLPVPFVELSAGMCRQLGNFAAGQVSSIACNATDKNGRKYELQFESDGSPIAIRRVKPSPPTIRQHG
ncbi:MAG: hypothetical protein ACLQDM_28740 [Bradyrhizobium sp.]